MELNNNEFSAMQSGIKEFFHEHLDMRALKKLGLTIRDKRVLEIGCGSGYGAELLMKYAPKSYVGIDIMEDQIGLANNRHLFGADFKLMDATEIGSLGVDKIDEVIDFRILHHVPEWKNVLLECYKLLSPGGAMYVVEPYRAMSKLADAFLDWQHPSEALFKVDELEKEMQRIGFTTRKKSIGYGFVMVGLRRS